MIRFNCLIYKEYRSNTWFLLDIFQQIQLSLSSSDIHYALEYYITGNWDTKFLHKKMVGRNRLVGITIKENFCIKKEIWKLNNNYWTLIYARLFQWGLHIFLLYFENVLSNHLEKRSLWVNIISFFQMNKTKSCASCLRSHCNN